MDEATRKLTIATLRGRVSLLQIACDAFSKDFKRETLTTDERSQIAHKWDSALKEWRSIRSTLAQLENDEREDVGHFGRQSTGRRTC